MGRHGRQTSRNTVFLARPAPDKRHLTVDDMLRAAHQLGQGGKICAVAHSVSTSPTSVHRIKQRATGRVTVLREYEYDRSLLAHFVAFCLFENPLATGQAIAEEARKIALETSVTSVNKLASDLSFKTLMTQKQEKLSEAQKEYRVQFCDNIKFWIGYYLPWIFTDESMIVLNPLKRKLRVIHGMDVPQKYIDVIGYPTKVMVWAAVGRDFKSALVRVTGILNANEYQRMLTECKIFELADAIYGKRAYVFQQDGARPHTAKSTVAFLRQRTVILPPEYRWPACSPDLNIIENLWSIVKHSMNYADVTDADSMFGEAERVWNSISLEMINKLVDDFYPRLDACRAVKGECLNRHKAILRGFRISEEEGQRALSESCQNEQRIRSFQEQSRRFFRDDIALFTSWRKLPVDGNARKYQISLSDSVWAKSALICLTLPSPILNKSGLPLDPIVHEKLVRVDQPGVSRDDNDDW